MSPELTAKFEKLNERMEACIARVLGYPDSVRNAPLGKGFSPVQVIEHLAISDGSYMDFIARAAQQPVTSEIARPRFLYKLVLKQLAKPSGLTPAPRQMIPTGIGSVEAQAERWRLTRQLIFAHLSKYEDNAICLKHNLFGNMSPAQLVELLSVHQDYHDLRLPS
jgi:hypothetical protein